MAEAALKEQNFEENVLDLFKPFEHFAKAMLDAYAIVDAAGHVVKSNQLFSALVGLTSKQILKMPSLDDMLMFEIRESQLPVKDILKYNLPTRIDEVRGKAGGKTGLNLIISIYPFLNKQAQVVGAFLMVRDVTAETNLQDKYKTTAIKSITDPLTGLYTRAYFEEYLESTMKSVMPLPKDSPQKSISIIMLDIDHFKKVNDVYGHQAGDYVIQTVADTMKTIFRKTDIICRYGGEEFLTIMPSTTVDGGAIAAEKLRKAVAEKVMTFDGKTIPVTISSGCAQINVGVESPEATIARADAALYESKHGGRNRVSIHDGKAINPFKS